jgi:hypothetical protein
MNLASLARKGPLGSDIGALEGEEGFLSANRFGPSSFHLGPLAQSHRDIAGEQSPDQPDWANRISNALGKLGAAVFTMSTLLTTGMHVVIKHDELPENRKGQPKSLTLDSDGEGKGADNVTRDVLSRMPRHDADASEQGPERTAEGDMNFTRSVIRRYPLGAPGI